MSDLFIERSSVYAADVARSLSGTDIFKDPDMARRCRLAAGNRRDLSDYALSLMRDSFSASDASERQGKLLAAFWDHYPVRLPDTKSRLLVNPPTGIDHPGFAMTLLTQPWLRGSYGETADNRLFTSMEAVSIPGDLSSFFTDVAVFWDFGFAKFTEDVQAEVALRLVPGATLSLIRPGAKHSSWVGWSGIDLSFKELLAPLKKVYKLRELSVASAGDAEIAIIGVEAKGKL